MQVAIIILAVVLLIALFWCISTVNSFKKKEIRAREALSGVEAALTKRYDLLTKLLDAAKGYMTHESGLFENVIKIRRGMSISELRDVQKQMDGLSGKIAAVAENYPELRSSGVFVELQSRIRDAEERLQAARRLYNANVTFYNTAIATSPAKLLAGSRQPLEFLLWKKRSAKM